LTLKNTLHVAGTFVGFIVIQRRRIALKEKKKEQVQLEKLVAQKENRCYANFTTEIAIKNY
jgi:hypothetical protein